jgi:competence protein ComEA
MKETFQDIMNSFNYKKFILPGILLIIMLVEFVYLFYILDDKKDVIKEENKTILNDKTIEKTEENITSTGTIYVDIKGNVLNPGVYTLDSGSRVIDVVNQAGGFTEGANTRFINLSKVLNDGDVIVIYSNAEIEEAKKSKIIYVETPCICEEVKNDACITQNVEVEEPNIPDNAVIPEDSNNGKININTATSEELQTLSGIGESKAQAIIDYRNTNGPFNSIEEIVNVSGISENLFAKIKENITV